MIDRLVKEIERKFGEASVFRFSDSMLPIHKPGFLSTGILGVDYVIGRPGIPLGRVSEISGFESVGKSTLAAHILAAFQKAGGLSVLFDTEHAYSWEWIKAIGIDSEKLIVVQPDTIQEACQLMEFIVTQLGSVNFPVCIVWDSVSATPTLEEVEGDFDVLGKSLSAHARILSQALRKLTNLIWNAKVSLIFVSQLKEKVGFIPGKSKIGGHAIGYHAALMLEIERKGFIKQGDEVVGIKCRCFAAKNKLAPPFRSIPLEISFEKGIDKIHSVIEVVKRLGMNRETGGGWYEFRGKKFQKKTASLVFDEKTIKEIADEIFASKGGTQD